MKKAPAVKVHVAKAPAGSPDRSWSRKLHQPALVQFAGMQRGVRFVSPEPGFPTREAVAPSSGISLTIWCHWAGMCQMVFQKSPFHSRSHFYCISGAEAHPCRTRATIPAMMNDRQRRFDALARRYADDLFRFAVWLCGDATLANDLVQETFMRAWKALDSLKEVDAAKGWLITILRREHARTFERKVLLTQDIDDVVVSEDKELTPEDRAERNMLRQAMLELETKYREPLVLQVVMGMSIVEIAEQLDLTESAVMTRVFRAREKLKARLKPDDGERGNVHELS